MRLTTKGQVTIPQAIRDRKRAASDGRGKRIVEAVRRAPKPKPGMTTAQLMALTRGE